MNSSTKVVVVDHGGLMFRSIFAWEVSKKFPATCIYMSMLLANLKRLHLKKDDLLILAVDSKQGSWRRNYDKDYKANRKENREKHEDIDWNYMFKQFNELVVKIDIGSPFHVVEINKCEADDIIAVSCRYFKDKEVVVVSSDSDMEQLVAHSNVKIFSPISKKFKVIKNPYEILAKKVDIEKVDNLISPILNDEQFERRFKLVNLLELPNEITKKVEQELDNIDKDKTYNLDFLPFKKTKDNFLALYK